MSNKTYDILKYIAQIVIPAISTLYFALAKIWGFPYGEEIVGTLSALDAFMGAILKISSNNYYAAIDAGAEQPPVEESGEPFPEDYTGKH